MSPQDAVQRPQTVIGSCRRRHCDSPDGGCCAMVQAPRSIQSAMRTRDEEQWTVEITSLMSGAWNFIVLRPYQLDG